MLVGDCFGEVQAREGRWALLVANRHGMHGPERRLRNTRFDDVDERLKKGLPIGFGSNFASRPLRFRVQPHKS